MKNIKEKLIKLGWIKDSEKVLFERLKFDLLNLENSPAITENNIKFRNEFLNDIQNNNIEPQELRCCIDSDSDDILISEIDRYGLPIRTILNNKNGLIRTDPYYTKEYLNKFYSQYYRNLYTTNHISNSSFIINQIRKGEVIFDFLKKYITDKSNICEIGCGMGGILLPFKLNGFNVTGIDIGEEYIRIGNRLNLNLVNGEIDVLINERKKFDLIIVNHVLEHIPEVKEFLSKTKKILNENGLLYIAVPGISSISSNYNYDLLMFLQNAHCWHFTRNTLTVLLNQVGFEVIEFKDEISCISVLNPDVKPTLDLKNESAFVLENLKAFEFKYQAIQNDNAIQLNPNLNKSFIFKFCRRIIRLSIKILNKIFNSKYSLQ